MARHGNARPAMSISGQEKVEESHGRVMHSLDRKSEMIATPSRVFNGKGRDYNDINQSFFLSARSQTVRHGRPDIQTARGMDYSFSEGNEDKENYMYLQSDNSITSSDLGKWVSRRTPIRLTFSASQKNATGTNSPSGKLWKDFNDFLSRKRHILSNLQPETNVFQTAWTASDSPDWDSGKGPLDLSVPWRKRAESISTVADDSSGVVVADTDLAQQVPAALPNKSSTAGISGLTFSIENLLKTDKKPTKGPGCTETAYAGSAFDSCGHRFEHQGHVIASSGIPSPCSPPLTPVDNHQQRRVSSVAPTVDTEDAAVRTSRHTVFLESKGHADGERTEGHDEDGEAKRQDMTMKIEKEKTTRNSSLLKPDAALGHLSHVISTYAPNVNLCPSLVKTVSSVKDGFVGVINSGLGIVNPNYTRNFILPSDMPGSFQCSVCNKVMKSKRTYNRHRRSHLPVKHFLCVFCSKGFNDSFDLKRHTRIHTGNKPYACPIPPCTKTFAQRVTLENHMEKIHGAKQSYRKKERRPKVYVCELCQTTFHTT
ncbi:zinc finger protein 865-like [Pomacea canaliculata]|uniref:zinc finger protein 865-like n=1 Tax=Pomacea canaliculata TaxID=400727 RepID=UPI000D739F9C|nr:zinc finger protein 865-like [Pomacea canaliculata]